MTDPLSSVIGPTPAPTLADEVPLLRERLPAADDLSRFTKAMSALKNRSLFSRFAQATARVTGGPWAFMLALVVVAVWGITGPLFDFNDTWQLVINTGTTIITFLMVFLIQNTQNRDAEAMHIKLDELIRTAHEAQNSLLDLEELEPEDLEQIRAGYSAMAKEARETLRHDGNDEAPSAQGGETQSR